MCLLIFAHAYHPQFPLVVAANRDEFYARATRPAEFWEQDRNLLAGRDLEQGGTWMGITRGGRFAAVTNYRDPARTAPAPRSRGHLALDFLRDDRDPGQWARALATEAQEYAGFNLLLGADGDLWYLNNSSAAQPPTPQRLSPGLYGLSNAALDTPWPKVTRGKQRLAQLLATTAPTHDELAQVVADRSLSAPGDLHALGLDREMDQLLSAQFIAGGHHGYGTRSTTTLWVEAHGRAHWRELSFDDRGELSGSRDEEFGFDEATG